MNPNQRAIPIERRKKDSARLIWDTKPRRAPNPKDIDFQTAEIVVPNLQRDQALLSAFTESLSKTTLDRSKMNRLVWGDNLLAMQALLASGYDGKIDLIYIDPPFWTGENYYTKVTIGQETVERSPAIAQRLAFKDCWSGGIDSYLDMLYPRLQLMKRLLSDDGCILVHIDYHVGPYVRTLMDEIFGPHNLRNEIVVKRTQKNFIERDYIRSLNVANDTVFMYARSEKSKLHPPYKEEKREATWHAFDAPNWAGTRPNLDYELFGHRAPPGRVWTWTRERAERAIENGMLRPNPKTGKPEYLIPEREKTLCTNLWDDLIAYSFKYGFSTEKNEKFIERILEMCSDQGDLVADFFCGSGTTLAVAERLNRRWIGCDFSKVAIQITRNRLVGMDAKVFMLENLGNYQRHLIYLSGVRIYEMQRIILKLYGADQRENQPELGIRRAEDGAIELVYVGYPDRPVTSKRVDELAREAERLDGVGYKRLVILAWDYEYNYEELLNERKRTAKAKWKTEVLNKTIPPEVYEYLKTAKTEEEIEPLRGKIQFHEKPYLKLSHPSVERISDNKLRVTVGIERYVIFDYPIEDENKRQEIMEIVKDDYFALVDYWAVDWDYDNTTFRSVWQSFRGFGQEIKEIPKKVSKDVEGGKQITIAVRLVDVFGNDASATQLIDLRRY